MNVSKVRILCIALLVLSFFVPAAGAIYIEGYTPPDDGLPHILLADADTGVSSTGVASTSVAAVPGKAIRGGWAPARVSPILSPNNGPSASSIGGGVPSYSGISMPSFSVPSFNGDVIYGSAIGHAVDPAPPGYWDRLSGMELHTNMPTLNVPRIFG